MAKKKVTQRRTTTTKGKTTKKKTTPSRMKSRKNFMSGVIQKYESKTGNTGAIASLGQSFNDTVGIPVPSFCLEYLLDSTCIPLQAVFAIRGEPKVRKTGLACELIRIGMQYCQATGVIFEHENKWNPEWAASIIGFERAQDLHIVECNSVDDWQTKLQDITDAIKYAMDGTQTNPGAGREFPAIFVVDSIVGMATKESQDKVKKQGSVSRAFPVEALAINQFMKTYPASMKGYPFMLMLINHMKPRMDDRTKLMTDNVAGGFAPQFSCTYDLRIKKGKPINRAKETGAEMRIRAIYNSAGADRREIVVECATIVEEKEHIYNEAEYRDKTIFDWHWATSHLLLELLDGTPKGNEAKTALGLAKPRARRGACELLGITKKDPVTYRELGGRISSSPECMAILRKIFGIKQRKLFKFGYDYMDQRKATFREQLNLAVVDTHGEEESGEE